MNTALVSGLIILVLLVIMLLAGVPIAVALGIGVIQANGCLALFPDWAKTIFGESAVVIATITAVTLNLILPEEETQEEEVQENAVQMNVS